MVLHRGYLFSQENLGRPSNLCLQGTDIAECLKSAHANEKEQWACEKYVSFLLWETKHHDFHIFHNGADLFKVSIVDTGSLKLLTQGSK